MKRTIKAISYRLFIIALGIGALSSCISDKDSPGFEFMPDMYRSPAVEPYVDYGWIKDREKTEYTTVQSAKVPPVYTIPYHGNAEGWEMYLPYHRRASKFASKTHNLFPQDGWLLSDDAMGDYFTSAEDVNPIVLTAENQEAIFKEGKRLYDINCIHCHGEKGDGKGQIVENGSYAGVPNYKNLQSLKDGQLFYSIYYGKGMMGAHAMQLNNKEIWTLVHYINKFRIDNYGTEGAGNPVEATDSTTVSDETAEIVK
ncbi:MAG: cytochrome c [Brumimicrobium sp.]|nr:cytochrome c [Brumimicrobium sp.]MCO5269550.1 cytochrome c [Brumimicrobium sp.]